MTADTPSGEKLVDPIERTTDLPRIMKALSFAAQDALRHHKLVGNPIAVWRDGKVVWIPPEEISVDVEARP